MIWLVAGALFVLTGASLEYSGQSLIGTTAILIGVVLGLKGKRQVYGEKTKN